MRWEPKTGQLWTIVNERHEIGANLVPDYLSPVRDDGFYGWFYSDYGAHLETRVKQQRPDLVAKAIKPDYALGSDVAALGLWFIRGDALPARFNNGAFISEYGGRDRSPLSGQQVVYVAFRNGKPFGAPQPVITGF